MSGRADTSNIFFLKLTRYVQQAEIRGEGKSIINEALNSEKLF